MSTTADKDQVKRSQEYKGLSSENAAIALRSAFGCYPTGVTIVTCLCPETGERIGVTANSYTSVSMTPPLISWNLGNKAFSLNAFRKASHFAVHLLHANQSDLAMRFATKSGPKFEGLDSEEGHGRAPLLGEYTARFECVTSNIVEAGDHFVFFGEIVEMEIQPRNPLIFYGSKFHDGAVLTF